jgi:hypothetical protein
MSRFHRVALGDRPHHPRVRHDAGVARRQDHQRSHRGAAVDPAACEEQAKAAADSRTLRLVLGSGFAGMFLVAVCGAADGAHTAALVGGSAGDGAWIGAVVGAGVGAIIGLVIGLKRAQEAKATCAARLEECLGEGRAPMTREDQTAAPAVTSLSLGGSPS